VNTDRLIDLLSANLEPVGRGRLPKAVLLAVAAGVVAALGVMLATVGTRPDLNSPAHLAWSAIKLLFGLSVAGLATPFLLSSARPGFAGLTRAVPALIPFLVVDAAAVAALVSHPYLWSEMLRGATSVSPARCLVCILTFAGIPLIALTHVLREGAPTQPKACGALAGTVAGGVGAAVYAFTCASDSFPFIAAWFGAAIALCAFIGALLGARLFRW
jgi:hypothetical protein